MFNITLSRREFSSFHLYFSIHCDCVRFMARIDTNENQSLTTEKLDFSTSEMTIDSPVGSSSNYPLSSSAEDSMDYQLVDAWFDNIQMHPNTIPTHFHACHTAPTGLVSSAQLGAFAYLRCPRTTRSHQVPLSRPPNCMR